MVTDSRATVFTVHVSQGRRIAAVHHAEPELAVRCRWPGLLVAMGGAQVAESDAALIARRPHYGPRRVMALITRSAPEGSFFFEVGDGHHIGYTDEV